MNIDEGAQAFTVYTNSSFDEDDYEDEYQECSWNMDVNEDVSYGMYTNPLYDGHTWISRNVDAYESNDEHYYTPRFVDEYKDVHYYDRSQEDSYVHPHWTPYQSEYDYQRGEYYEESTQNQSQHQSMYEETPLIQEEPSLVAMLAQFADMQAQQRKFTQMMLQKLDDDIMAHKEILAKQYAQQSNLSSNYEGEQPSQPDENFTEPITKSDIEYIEEGFLNDEDDIDYETDLAKVQDDLSAASQSEDNDNITNMEITEETVVQPDEQWGELVHLPNETDHIGIPSNNYAASKAEKEHEIYKVIAPNLFSTSFPHMLKKKKNDVQFKRVAKIIRKLPMTLTFIKNLDVDTTRRSLPDKTPSKTKTPKKKRNDPREKEDVGDGRSHNSRYKPDNDHMLTEMAMLGKPFRKYNIGDQIEKRGDPSRSPFKDRREEGPSSSSTPLEKGSLHRTSQVCFF